MPYASLQPVIKCNNAIFHLKNCGRFAMLRAMIFKGRVILYVLLLVSLAVRAADECGDPASLRAAVAELSAQYGTRYDRGAEFLHRLDALPPGDAAQLAALRREALAAHPLLVAYPLLFAVRPPYHRDHHNTETVFQTGEINTRNYRPGGPLKLLDLRRGVARMLVDPGPNGLARDPDVFFDGQRIVFSMRKNIGDDYHLYEVAATGGAPRQLTSAPGVFDIDPFYLADGRIAFTSSREPKYCGCNAHIMGNLFRMEADGANIVQIGRNNLFEGHGSLLEDGRIIYDRWEYVDRNFGDAQGLWTVNPDGTAHAVWYGNNTPAPGGVIEPRQIPGTPLVLCVLSSCHDRPWGALAILDRRRGVDGRAPVVRTWPATAVARVREPGMVNGAWDAFTSVQPRYADPYPLDTQFFLCSRQIGTNEEQGIYLVDTFGNEVCLHAESPGCADPMLLMPHLRPPLLPERRNYADRNGTFYVTDVYAGTHMAGVTRGSVKWLRVVEAPEKRFWTYPAWNGQGYHRPAMNWSSFENKRILGTVPVEADGSAYFEAPAERFVYFQLLDKDGLMIQSMRSGAFVQPGERAGCIGCHDDRLAVPPPAAAASRALQRAPSRLMGWQGEPRLFNYRAEVQPVFDKYCVRCHDFGKPAGEKLVLAGDRTAAFAVSYVDLYLKKVLKVVGAGPAEIQPANSWGARASRLVQVLQKGHNGIKLLPEELERIVTWVDLNAPYYPSYATAWPDSLYGRCPLASNEVTRLKQLGLDLNDHLTMTRVSFDRPDASPALIALAEVARKEALTILRTGAARLAAQPNPDAPNFIACETDRRREAKYEQRETIEAANRAALRLGTRRYDESSIPTTKAPPIKGAAW
ncbi:MAG: hypothetical protein EPN23_08680 [Verrucomicrobia bacterium]|nr:MAG: hypothetical protein EPN23_08680 [Verrucomicrobiota bacterium]